MSLLALYVPCDSTFISTQFLVLNWNGLFFVSSNEFIIFWCSIIIVIHYFITLKLLIICCLFSEDIYLSYSFVTVSELLCGKLFKALMILSTILLAIKSQFLLLFFSFLSSFKCICSRLFSIIKKFLTVFTYIFFFPYLYQKTETHNS